jgi:membrane peptidoglycan carboxypeptidase
LDEKVAYLMNNVLSDNNARLLTFGENSLLNMNGRPVAVKTGTTNDKRDNWTVGWTSEVIVESWVGNNDNSAMKGIASGVSGASPIWRKIINEVIKVRPPKPFDRPDSVEDVKVDDVSGYPEHDGFPAHADVAIRGTLPVPPDPIHTKLKLCPGQNKLATIAQVAAGDYEEKEYYVFKEEDPFEKDGINKWQEGINAWVASQGDSRYHPPTDQCEGGQAAVVRINKPEHQHNYDGNEIDVNMEIFGDKKVEKLEIVVNDQVRETLTGQPYQTKLTLSPGVYKLKGRAYLEGGDKVESGELLFGMGGVKWEGSNPTPSPTPGP